MDYPRLGNRLKHMRSLGPEKNSQHETIEDVILRDSFLSAKYIIISTLALGMCPCGF